MIFSASVSETEVPAMYGTGVYLMIMWNFVKLIKVMNCSLMVLCINGKQRSVRYLKRNCILKLVIDVKSALKYVSHLHYHNIYPFLLSHININYIKQLLFSSINDYGKTMILSASLSETEAPSMMTSGEFLTQDIKEKLYCKISNCYQDCIKICQSLHYHNIY